MAITYFVENGTQGIVHARSPSPTELHAQTQGGWYTCFLSSYIVPTIKTRVQEELAPPFCLAMLTQSINVLAICLDPVAHDLKRAIEKRKSLP